MHGNILDTNVVVRILNGDTALASKVSLLDDVYIPAIVLGELMYGAEKSARKDFNKARALELCADFHFIGTDSSTALEYGRIKAALERAGKTISENDIWIASIALNNGMTVLSQDRHFSYIEGLSFVRI